MDSPPLVVTLALPDDVEARFDAERRQLFPPGRTAVGAHVTLFHAIPGELEDDVRVALDTHAESGLVVRISGVISLGRGAAYLVESHELGARHRALQHRWRGSLTRQDQQPLRAHVTVQNKVDPAQARRTVETLRAAFVPFEADALGFRLWRYDGGPWTLLATVAFRR